MDGLSQFLAMGGYAAYVWSAYGAALMVMAVLLVSTLRSLKRREGELALLQGRSGRRRTQAGPRAEMPGGAAG